MSVEKKQQLEKLKTDLETYHSQLDMHTQKFKDELLEVKKQMDKVLSGYFNDAIKKANDITKNSSSLVDSLESERNRVLKSDLEALKKKMDSIFNNYKKSVNSLQSQTKSMLTEQVKSIKDQESQFQFTAKDIFEEERSTVKNIQEDFEGVVEHTKSQIIKFLDREEANFRDSAASLEYLGDELREFSNHTTEIVKDVDQKINNLFSSTNTTVDGHFEQSIQTIKNSALELISKLEDTITKQKEEMEQIQTDLSKKINNTVNNNISSHENTKQAFKSSLDTFSKEQVDAFKSILDKSSERFSNEISLQKDKTQNSIDELRKDFRSNLYSALTDVASGFSSFHDIFIDQIESLISTLQKKSEEMKQTLDSIIVKRIGEVQTVSETLELQLEKLLDESSENFKKEYEQLKEDFDVEMNKKSNEFESSLNTFKTKLTELFTSTQDEVKQNVQSMNSEITDSVTTGFSASSKKIDEIHLNYKDATSNYIKEQETWLNDSRKTISNDVKRSQEDLSASLSSLQPEVGRLTDTHATKISETRKEILEFLDRSSREVRNDVESLERDAIQEISQLNLTIEGKINERSDELHKKVRGIIRSIIQTQENQTTDFIQNLTEKVDKSLEDISALQPQAIAQTEQQINNYGVQVDKMIQDMKKVQSNVNSNIRRLQQELKESEDEFKDSLEMVQRNSENSVKNLEKRTKKVLDKTNDILKSI
jgi:hypothetical protein